MKTKMETKEKVAKTVKLYEEIKALWGTGGCVDISIHGVNMDKLSSEWKVEGRRLDSGHRYWSANRSKNPFDITLFD